MHINWKLPVIIAAMLVLWPVAAFPQSGCPVMPPGFLCITQAAGNQAAENKRELDATKAALAVRDAALLEKDKIIADNKAEATKSINELKKALGETEVKLATSTGQLIGAEANVVRMTAIVDFMLKNGRKKCYGLCVQF